MATGRARVRATSSASGPRVYSHSSSKVYYSQITTQQELSALFRTKLTIDNEPDDARYPRLPLMEKLFEGYGHLKDAVVKAYE